MTVQELIEKLSSLPPDAKVFYEGGDYKDDWREVNSVIQARNWGGEGVVLE